MRSRQGTEQSARLAFEAVVRVAGARRTPSGEGPSRLIGRALHDDAVYLVEKGLFGRDKGLVAAPAEYEVGYLTYGSSGRAREPGGA